MATLIERLQQRLTLKYAGNCKCGNCQLVEDCDIRATITELERLSAEVARLSAELEQATDMLSSAGDELQMIRDALGVEYEPHQSLLERTIGIAKAARTDSLRMDYLEREFENEQADIVRTGDTCFKSLFRWNIQITRSNVDIAIAKRAAIDAAREG